MQYQSILRNILDQEKYLCLATVTTENTPWTSPISYIYDGAHSLYFVSHIDSLHIQNLRQNPKVAWSIFDSHQILKNAFGIQATGTAYEIGESDIDPLIREHLYARVSLAVLAREHVLYRIDIDDVYLPDAERWKDGHDMRVRVMIG